MVTGAAVSVLPAARADSVDGYTTSSLNATGADYQSFDNLTTASLLIPTTIQSAVSGPGYAASGWAEASLGQLHTFSSSMQAHDASNEYVQNHTQVSNQNIHATVVDTGVPTGTPVDLLFTLDIDGTFIDEKGGLGYSSSTIGTLGGDDGNGSSFQLNFDSRMNAAPFHQTALLHTAVGHILSLGALLDSFTYVASFQDKELAVQDFSNTLVYTIDSLTSGASVITASGYDFSTHAVSAVPEVAPGPVILFGLGVLSLASRKRGRKPS